MMETGDWGDAAAKVESQEKEWRMVKNTREPYSSSNMIALCLRHISDNSFMLVFRMFVRIAP